VTPVTVIIAYTALPGKETAARDALDALTALVVRSEPDCLGIRVYQDPEAPASILLDEQWTSTEAYFGPHFETPHLRAFVAGAGEFFAGPPTIRTWSLVAEHRPS
jgi:quinol monooxygenase YgiN